MNLFVEPRAQRDFDDLIDWLAERSPSAARRAARQLLAAIDRLLDFPQSAPDAGRGRREAIVRFGREGFVVRYRISGQTIIVQRVYQGLQQRD
jgi:plasmid stabilization system protein ParE